MLRITDADREAAKALREVLADASGFWHHGSDEGVLCRALARHRIEAEERLMEKLTPLVNTAIVIGDSEGRKRAPTRLDGDAMAAPRRIDRLPS
jgi:hypothetical protein